MTKMDLVTANPDDPAGGRNGIRARKDIARWRVLLLVCLCLCSVIDRDVWSSQLSRYLDPDPLLLATTHGGDSEPPREIHNPRFHALNQAIVQLVGQAVDRSWNSPRN